MCTDGLNGTIWIKVNYVESQFALLSKIIYNFEVVGVVWVQVIVNNFSMVNLQPVSLVSVPLRLEHRLGVGFVSALIQILEITSLHEHLDDAKLSS